MRKIKPSHWTCESCPHWDDINGCWADCNDFGSSDYCEDNVDGEGDEDD
jgi:hypothetical protein